VLAAEFSSRKWSGYSDTGEDDANQYFQDTYRVAVGGEFTPDPGSVDSYMKRIAYRAGFNYAKSPLNLGEQMSNAALHAGVSLPIGSIPRPPEYNQSFLNLGVAFGKNGTTNGGLLQENYVRFMVGVSLSSSWFIRPKFD